MYSVAHILETPIENHGGLNLLARELACGLSAHYNVYVFCPESTVMDGSSQLQVPGWIHRPWPRGCNLEQIRSYLTENLEKFGIDVAVFHGGDFGWGPSRSHVSMINKVQESGVDSIYVNHQTTPAFSTLPSLDKPKFGQALTTSLRFLSSWLLKILQLRATAVEIVVSENEKAQAILRYPFWREKFIQIYHSRLPPTCESLVQSFKKERIILCMGHFAYRKGQHVLLEAFANIATQHPEWKLRLVGSSGKSDYSDYLQKITETHGIHDQVEMITETDHPDGFFKESAIYVQPSLFEAYGLALQEAMFFGCACIGSDTGGIPDSISDPEFLFPAGDVTALSSILERLIRSSTLLAKQQQTALANSKAFNRTREQMILQYRDIIDHLIVSRRQD